MAGCSPKYDVILSEISFDHQEGFDIIRYIAENPTEYNLTCDLKIILEGRDDIEENFIVNAGETEEFSTTADIPTGETKVILSTRCKPVTQ